MTRSHDFLEASARKTIRTIALVLLVSSGISTLPTAVVLVLGSSLGGWVIFANGIAIMIGSGLALLGQRRALWQMILPLAASIVIVECSTSIFLSELKVVVTPFLAVVVLLANLGNNRRFTVATTAVCALLAALLIGIQAPLPTASQLGSLLVPIQIVVVCALIIVVWAVSDRLTHTQNIALDMVEQRATEAEAAHLQAEASREEIEQRAAEQRRLLDLVQTLELPVMPINDEVLVAPLVGNLDSRRMAAIRQAILSAVARQRTKVVILDLTGITIIDTAVAHALMETAQAVRLLGAQTLISGIRASVAHTLASLNTSLGTLQSVPNLGVALEHARTLNSISRTN